MYTFYHYRFAALLWIWKVVFALYDLWMSDKTKGFLIPTKGTFFPFVSRKKSFIRSFFSFLPSAVTLKGNQIEKMASSCHDDDIDIEEKVLL